MQFPDPPTFFKKVAIDKYDTYLIISATRFLESDRILAEKVRSMGKSFFFVRTKIDIDKKNERRSNKKTFNEQEMLNVLRRDCNENLEKIGFKDQKVFLVSSVKQDRWDFDLLKKAILLQLPSKQKEALTFSLHSHSKDMVSEKIKVLRGTCSYCIGAISSKTRIAECKIRFQLAIFVNVAVSDPVRCYKNSC